MRTEFPLLFILMVLFCGRLAVAAPTQGDTYVYRVSNAYNNETRGQLTYRVDNIDSDRITVSVTPDQPSLGLPYTNVSTRNGNWLRHPLINHDAPVEYTFSPAYPAYMTPLDTGKSWSTRVRATSPNSARNNSVRVDGEVLGPERITTPAGVFDTIKVRRRVYAGDWGTFTSETTIIETDWYAPALGRQQPILQSSVLRNRPAVRRWQSCSRRFQDGSEGPPDVLACRRRRHPGGAGERGRFQLDHARIPGNSGRKPLGETPNL